MFYFFFFSSRRRHTRLQGDWSSDVCSSDLRGRAGVHRAGSCVAGRWEGLSGIADQSARMCPAGALPARPERRGGRESGVEGKRGDLGGRRIIKKKKKKKEKTERKLSR